MAGTDKLGVNEPSCDQEPTLENIEYWRRNAKEIAETATPTDLDLSESIKTVRHAIFLLDSYISSDKFKIFDNPETIYFYKYDLRVNLYQELLNYQTRYNELVEISNPLESLSEVHTTLTGLLDLHNPIIEAAKTLNNFNAPSQNLARLFSSYKTFLKHFEYVIFETGIAFDSEKLQTTWDALQKPLWSFIKSAKYMFQAGDLDFLGEKYSNVYISKRNFCRIQIGSLDRFIQDRDREPLYEKDSQLQKITEEIALPRNDILGIELQDINFIRSIHHNLDSEFLQLVHKEENGDLSQYELQNQLNTIEDQYKNLIWIMGEYATDQVMLQSAMRINNQNIGNIYIPFFAAEKIQEIKLKKLEILQSQDDPLYRATKKDIINGIIDNYYVMVDLHFDLLRSYFPIHKRFEDSLPTNEIITYVSTYTNLSIQTENILNIFKELEVTESYYYYHDLRQTIKKAIDERTTISGNRSNLVRTKRSKIQKFIENNGDEYEKDQIHRIFSALHAVTNNNFKLSEELENTYTYNNLNS